MDESLDDQADLVELSFSGKGQRSGRGGRGKGAKSGGGGGDGGKGGQGREVHISKALSKLLRHDAEKEGLKLDAQGFARVDQVLEFRRLKGLQATFADIQIAVTDNAKQRFALKSNTETAPSLDTTSTEPSHWLIRANQGHSITLDSAAHLTPITIESNNIPDIVVHGTYYAFYPAIVASGGMKPMTRNHVHFSTGLPDGQGVISGMRVDAELLIYVDVKKSLEDGGMLWWVSDNGVVLTEGGEDSLVPTKYWQKVEGRRADVGVLWLDGVEVAELPTKARGRKPPNGKGGKRRDEGDRGKGRDPRRGGGRAGERETKATTADGPVDSSQA